MAEQQELETLNIKVVSDTKDAQDGLTKLADTLERIKGISSGGKGFSNIQKNIDAITASMSKVESGGILKLKYLSQSLKALGEVKISKTIPDRLTAIGEAVDLLKSVDTSKFTEISQGMQTLSSVGNVRISGAGAKNAAAPAAADNSSLVGMSKQTGEFIAETSEKLNQGKAMFADFADKAHSAFGNVGLAVLKLNAEMRKFFDAHNLSLRRFGSDIGKFLTAPFRKAQSVVKAFTGKFSNFFAMFKKRAMYRAINGIISAITDGFKTGTDNLYQYSKAISGPFADSMDRIATTLLYFKNSIGAAVGPLINMLAPAIEFCTDKAVEFLNTINQLFARLSGASSWTKAIRYPKEYAEAADDATKANEELKKTILGFDELNVLQDNKSKSKKSGKEADDYSKMFEEVALTAATSPFEGFFTPFRKAWENEGENTIKAITTAFEQVKGLIGAVANSFATVWNNGTGQQTIETILRIWQNIFGTIGNVAERLKVAWQENETGTRIVQGIFDIFNSILGTIERITGSTKEWAGQLNFSPLLESVANAFEKIKPLVDNIGNALSWLWENVVLPIIEWGIEDLVPAGIDLISAAIDLLNTVIEKAKPGFKWLWENFLQPLGKWTGKIIVGALQSITDLLNDLNDLISGKTSFTEFIDQLSFGQTVLLSLAVAVGGVVAAFGAFTAISAIVSGVGAVIGALTSPVGIAIAAISGLIAIGVLLVKHWDDIAAAARKAWEAVTGFINTACEKISDGVMAFLEGMFNFFVWTWDAIVTVTKAAWNGLKDFFSGLWKIISSTAQAIWNGLKSFFIGIFEGIVSVGKAAWTGFKDFWVGLWQLIKTTATNVWNGLKAFFSNTWNWIRSTASNIWNGVKTTVLNVVNGLKTGITTAFEFVSSHVTSIMERIRSTMTNVWEGIKNVVRGAINGVLGFVDGLVNGVINGFNTMINALNRLSFDVPDWVPGIGGSKFGFNIQTLQTISIPRLEKGGMVPNNGTMFIAGEAGAEVVANIGNRTGVMNTDQMQKSVEQGILNATGSIANAVAAAVAKSGQNGIAPTVEVTVKADSETLYKTVKKGEKYFNNRYHVVVGV